MHAFQDAHARNATKHNRAQRNITQRNAQTEFRATIRSCILCQKQQRTHMNERTNPTGQFGRSSVVFRWATNGIYSAPRLALSGAGPWLGVQVPRVGVLKWIESRSVGVPPQPCLLGDPKEYSHTPQCELNILSIHIGGLSNFRACRMTAKTTSLLHSRGSPNKGAQNQKAGLPHPCLLGPNRGRKCYGTPIFSGIPYKGGRNQNWLPHP